MSHLYGWWMDWRSRCEVLLLLPGALDVVRNGKPHLACHRTAWQLQIGLFVLISVVSHVLRLTLSHLGHIAQGYYRRFFIYVSGLVPCNYCEILLSVFVSCSQNRMMWKKWRLIPVGKPEPRGLRGGRFREREERTVCVLKCHFCKISNRQIMCLSNTVNKCILIYFDIDILIINYHSIVSKCVMLTKAFLKYYLNAF